jgi:hypothetical protein
VHDKSEELNTDMVFHNRQTSRNEMYSGRYVYINMEWTNANSTWIEKCYRRTAGNICQYSTEIPISKLICEDPG